MRPRSRHRLYGTDLGLLQRQAGPRDQARAHGDGHGQADLEGLSSSVDVTIKVTDVDEAPEISGSSSEMFPENGDGVVAVFTAVDPEEKSVTWSMVITNPNVADITTGRLYELRPVRNKQVWRAHLHG